MPAQHSTLCYAQCADDSALQILQPLGVSVDLWNIRQSPTIYKAVSIIITHCQSIATTNWFQSQVPFLSRMSYMNEEVEYSQVRSLSPQPESSDPPSFPEVLRQCTLLCYVNENNRVRSEGCFR